MSRRPRPGGAAGFTLVEVMIALAIVALTSMVLLDRRVEVVRDAGRSRDLRTSWMLASQKMAELELDDSLWAGPGGQSHGDFADLDPEYRRFQWEYLIQRQPIDCSESDAEPGVGLVQPRELMKLTLAVRAEGEPVLIEAQFPVFEARPQASEKPGDPGAPPGPDGPNAPKRGPK